LIFIPIAILLAFSDKLLILVGQDSRVAYAAQRFLVYQLPGLYMIVQYDTLRRYLQAQGTFDIPVKGLIISCIFHICALSIALKYIQGDPLVICAITTNFTMIIDYVLLRYFAIESLAKTNKLGLLDGAFDNWDEYLRLALPSAFIICAEWWMYEVLAIFAGFIGIQELATIIIIFNTHALCYDISYGLSQAASSIIGRTLAESGQFDAKKVVYSICVMESIFCIIMTIVYLIFPFQIIRIFTDEQYIVDMYISCIYYIIVMFLIDSMQIVIGGIIRGIGEQAHSSLVSFISYALVTLPCALFFSFYFSMGIQGLILAYILGIAFNTVLNGFILYKSDWELAIAES
jgi:MATE family multidrug resistance protein